MIQFFAQSVLSEVLDRCTIPDNSQLKLSPDSENAIVFETQDTFFYWLLSVNPESDKYELQEVILNKNLDVKSDECYYYLTVNEALDHITGYIAQH